MKLKLIFDKLVKVKRFVLKINDLYGLKNTLFS